VIEAVALRVDFMPISARRTSMTQPQAPVANPFALLMDPQAIFKAIENSERLERLHSRVCRPLDRPMLPHASANEVDSFDQVIDCSHDEG
jgi:hypothetical protein